LDLSTVPVVDTQLSELMAAGFSSVVVDLRKLSFLDSSGVRLLLSWAAKSRAAGVDLSFIPGPSAVQRVFDLTGVGHHLGFSKPSDTVGQRTIQGRRRTAH
jgi:anti-anti-sigma factor